MNRYAVQPLMDIFTPTSGQVQDNALFRWLLAGDPDAATICVRILIRHQNRTVED